MQKLFIITGFLFLFAACSKPADKKAQLDKLVAERDKITQQILQLQQEIATTDSSGAFARAKTVSVTEIQPGLFQHFIEIQGRVDGDQNIGLNPKMPGVVSRILVKEGDRVSQGQTLIELDAEVSRRTLDEVKERLAFATTVYQKYKALWDQKIGSEIEYLSAKNNKESLEKSIKTLEETLEMARIISPINGTIEEIPVKVGHSVSPGFPAIRVINFTKIKVVAELAESYATRVNTGDQVRLYFPDYQQEIESTVSFTSKFINPVNRTFQIESRINAPADNFKANMIAVVKINDYSAPEAFSVPVNAVQKSGEGTYLFVVRQENGKNVARKQNVMVGMIYNGLAEIKSGLNKADRVVTMGYQDLYEGQPLSF